MRLRSWVHWRRGMTWMVALYLAAALVVVAGLAQPARLSSLVAAGVFAVLAFILIGLRVTPLYRLLGGLLAVAAVGYGAQSLPAASLLGVGIGSLFLLSFTVPTWLSPALLALVFVGELAIKAPHAWVVLSGLLVAAMAFGTLADQQKRLERDRRDLASASSELSHTLKQVEYLAFHDALTGLPNRRLLIQRLEEAVEQCNRDGGTLAVAFIDLDRFKAVNDGAGHSFGDRVLKAVATTISRQLSSGDVLGRQGGDEFILVLRSVNGEREAFDRLESLRRALDAGLLLDQQQVYATASFGVAFFPQDGGSADELLRRADLALYRAKDEGRNRVSLFNTELERQASTAFYLDSNLRRALASEQFFLEYQPQIDILTGRTVGIEALLRWKQDSEETLLPDQFLPEAQKLGLMEEIDAWVLARAISDVANLAWWRHHAVTLAVNISATSLESDMFIPRLLHLLNSHSVSPERLEVEITESVLSRNAEVVVGRLAELRRHGIGVAIDDFGVGYSSLSYLKNFPATRIKIDRGFVADVEQSDSIARAIVAVAKSLRLELVAEGVERRGQAELLLQIGCDVAQGFYYRPSVGLAEVQLKYSPEVEENPA